MIKYPIMIPVVKNRFSRDMRLMIALAALRNVYELFFCTFFVSYIMHFAANDIVSVGVYKLFEYVGTCAGFFAFANWCKQRSKITVFALQFITKIMLLGAIILAGHGITEYVVPMGLIYGVGAAMFYLPLNTMLCEKVPTQMMGRYIGFRNATMYAVKVAAPVILGLFITVGSYTEMAAALMVIAVAELAMTMMLSPSRHRTRRPIDFIGFWACVMRFRVLRTMFYGEICRGFAVGLMTAIIPMYTIYMFHTDLNLGILTTLFSLCTVVCSYVFGRFIPRRRYVGALMLCAAVTAVGMGTFVAYTVPATFILYNFVYASAITLFSQINEVGLYSLSHSRCVTDNHKIEFFVLRDFSLFIGRWIGFVGLIYVGIFGGHTWLRWYLIVIIAALLGAQFLSGKILAALRNR